MTAISAGFGFACALLSDGTVRCWGRNDRGQLGNGTTNQSSMPVPVSGLSGVTAISAGSNFACALLSGGTVECWGQNTHGQLGNGTFMGTPTCGSTCSPTPDPVVGLTGVIAITTTVTGIDFACALLSGGTVECWGNGVNGELGPAATTYSATPVTVTGLSGVTEISAGGTAVSGFTCALLSGGTVQCWGTTYSSTPQAVSGLSGVTALSAGYLFACAVLPGGSVQCWGDNTYGALGTGSTVNVTSPVALGGMGHATAVSAGRSFACAVLTDGSVECWGANETGQLGRTTMTTFSPQPAPVVW